MLRLALLLFCWFAVGCASSPVTGPQTYRDASMSFAVPAHWKITMRGMAGKCGHAFVEAPGEAVVFIKGVPMDRNPGLPEFARDFSRNANSFTPLGKVRSHGFRSFSDGKFGSGLKEPFTISVFHVEVPHTRTYRKRVGSHCVFYVVTQVADEDADANEKGFREILDSLTPQ